MRTGSLFSGCGGLDLGLEAAGFEIVWAVEKDPACRRVLERQRPGLEVLADVHHADDWLEPVDVLAGGFPCQDLSYAGRGGGLDGDRSGLWQAFADCVRLLRPAFVIVENVPGLATRGLGRVLYDLAALGYLGRWLRLRAADIGAPHLRERIFILAASADALGERRHWRGERRDPGGLAGPARDRLPATAGGRAWGRFEPAIRHWERVIGRAAPEPVDARGRLEPDFVEWMLGFPAGWTEGEARMARLRMLGNAVQVQVGEQAGRMLLDAVRFASPWCEAAASSLDDSRRAGRSRGRRPVVVPADLAESRPLST